MDGMVPLWTDWWARRDSNPQPSGYEPPALTIELQALASGVRRFGAGGRHRDFLRQHAILGTMVRSEVARGPSAASLRCRRAPR